MARRNREEYFGAGASNAADFFSTPIHVAGGTGPNRGVFGTLGRNAIVNMGLSANPLTGSGFGEISKTAGNSRQIQFSLKMID